MSQPRKRGRAAVRLRCERLEDRSTPAADFDYERWPTPADHPLKGSEILREKGYPEEIITAILSHADYLQDRYPRRTVMEKALYACDEITGLIAATALLFAAGWRVGRAFR